MYAISIRFFNEDGNTLNVVAYFSVFDGKIGLFAILGLTKYIFSGKLQKIKRKNNIWESLGEGDVVMKMKIKQLLFICLLLIAVAGCAEAVSAENSSAVSKTDNSLVPVSPQGVEELNHYPIFKYRDTGGAIEPLSVEDASQITFENASFVSYEPNGISLFVIALATVEDRQYIAVIDTKNIKTQFSKGGIANVWAGVGCYQTSQSVDAGNYKAIIKVFVNQRKFLPQDRGIVLVKISDPEKKTE